MEQIEDFVYDFKQQVQKFARANDDDANIALLKRLAQVIGYYDSSLVNPDVLKESTCMDENCGCGQTPCITHGVNEDRSYDELKAAAKDARDFKSFTRTLTPGERKMLRQRSNDKYQQKPKPGPSEALNILKDNRAEIEKLYDKYKSMGMKGTSALQRDLEQLLYPQADSLGLSKEDTEAVKSFINYGLGSISYGKIKGALAKKLHLNETK